MNKMFKTKDEYCHIFDDKLIITKTPEVGDLIEDYAKSINNVFKTLMVFFVFIPIFTALSFVFYNSGNIALAFNSGAMGFFFFNMAFYTLLCTSGLPLIKRENIVRVSFKNRFFQNIIIITYKEFGLYKKRFVVIDDEHINRTKEILLSQKILNDKNITLNRKKIDVFTIIVGVIFFSLIFQGFNKDAQELSAYYGIFFIILSFVLLSAIIRNLLRYRGKRK